MKGSRKEKTGVCTRTANEVLALLLKVWWVDQQHQRHQEACEKCRISGPSPALNQSAF